MAPTLPTDTTRHITEELIGFISALLADHGVPCVLWGNYLLNVYGVPSMVDARILVPDTLITQAGAALLSTGRMFECPDPNTCMCIDEKRPSPTPAAHFHFSHRGKCEDFISLHLQSETLWFLAPLALNEKPEGDFITASDPCLLPGRPRRGSGAFRDTTPVVYIPTAHRLLESYVRCIAKSSDMTSRYFFRSMCVYIKKYVEPDGLLEKEKIEGRCRKFYDAHTACEQPYTVTYAELLAAFAEPELVT